MCAGLSPGILYVSTFTVPLYTCNNLAAGTSSQVGQCEANTGCGVSCDALTEANNADIITAYQNACGTPAAGQGYGIIENGQNGGNCTFDSDCTSTEFCNAGLVCAGIAQCG